MSKVLVVEDDEDVRELIMIRLNRSGHDVLGVGSGREALHQVGSSGAPEVFVLDVGLPDMTGFDLLPTLRSLPGCASLPAVFLSARVESPDIARGRQLGATYLTKPFVAAALCSAVETALSTADRGDWLR